MHDDTHHCTCSNDAQPDDPDAHTPDGAADAVADGTAASAADGTADAAAALAEEAVGLPIPDEHVGAFIAEVFEDVERSTTWGDVVDRLVADEARDSWAALSPAEQVAEILDAADGYDRAAVERLDGIDDGDSTADVEPDYREALRLRRNADMLRDGVADAYSENYVDDDAMVAAVSRADFDTEAIARREEELERVATNHGFDFRPYGGTLMDGSDRPEGGVAAEW